MVESDLLSGYERLKALFLLASPGFQTFTTDETYIRQERTYKDELLGIFQREVAPLLTQSPDADSTLGEKCLALLRWPLDDMGGKPQNLVGWRYVSALTDAVRARRDGLTRFGQAIRHLLSATPTLGERIDNFGRALNAIVPAKSADLRRRGPQTAITTFYLGLADKDALLFIKSTQLDDFLDICDPTYEKDKEEFKGADYEHFLGLANQVFQSLRQEGWQPADLVDVQGFLWVSLTQAEGAYDDGTLVIRLTAGAIRNGYVTLSADAIDFFGDQYCGGEANDQIGRKFHLELPDKTTVATDIRRRKPGSAGRLRARFNALFDAAGLEPGSIVSINNVGKDRYRLELGNTTVKPEKAGDATDVGSKPKKGLEVMAKNIILYGPPGTGKTYHSANLAVEICHGSLPASRDEVRSIYEQLRKADRIAFVTFHQSFAYEEFVEGLRPVTELDSGSEIRYEVRDGVFKRLCSLAGRAIAPETSAAVDRLRERRIFKMSLGNSQLSDDSLVYEDSIRSNQLVLNWGGTVDYSNCQNAEDIRAAIAAQSDPSSHSDYAVIAIDYFKNLMHKGDLVLISDGNTRFRAIGEVVGDYQYINRKRYPHVRAVRWLATFDPSLPIETILEKRLSQMTIYRPDPSAIKWDALEELLRPKDQTAPVNYVLIIDEINRANISKVLGELITLLEADKRLGAPEALQTELPYSREIFGVPGNVYVLGTMNTADRSLALLDTALRRRFEFREMRPELGLLNEITVGDIKVARMLAAINDRIEFLYDREHAIGHAFFLPLQQSPSIENLAHIFDTKILPLLQEYFFEDWERIRLVLGDTQKRNTADQFIVVKGAPQLAETLFGGDDQNDFLPDGKRLYERNPSALRRPSAYLGIYGAGPAAESAEEAAEEPDEQDI
jgi:5-methylcytosine-specific restriction protein B